MDIREVPGGPRAPLNLIRELVFGTRDLSQAHSTEHDLRWLARQAAESGRKLPKIFSVCGTDDGCHAYSLEEAQYFQNLGYDCLFQNGPGDHNFDFWDQWLPVFLQWLPVRWQPGKGATNEQSE